jgi:predicted nucleic acid-binding protein
VIQVSQNCSNFKTTQGQGGGKAKPCRPFFLGSEVAILILLASTALPGLPPADPADRIIAATARIQGHVIVTRDRKLLDYAQEGHTRAIAC